MHRTPPRRPFALAVLVTPCLVALMVRPAAACDCVPLPPIPAALAESDMVFSGTAAEITAWGENAHVRFLVDRVWKGPIDATLDLSTPAETAACGVPFEVGSRYIVYAGFLDARPPSCELVWLFLVTDLCTRTRAWNPEEADGLGAPIWTAPPPRFRRGDANDDGAVNLSDAVHILSHLFQGGPGAECRDAMDSNDDGALDLSDAVFALNWLFLGGPAPPAPGATTPGFDPTDDPFPCGNAATLDCELTSSSTLPGVRIEISEGPCALSVAEARAGVRVAYRVVVEEDVSSVTSRQLASCQQPGPAGLLLRARIHGGDQLYCLCDLGKCFPEDHTTDLLAGDWTETFTWCGHNWFGPSDFDNPVGAPFPPGTYGFELHGTGTYVDGDGEAREFEITAGYEFELTP